MKRFSIIILCTMLTCHINAQNTDDKESKLTFSQIDTNYIEPKHFNFTVQLCANTSFDYFYGETKNDITLLSSASLAPIPTIKVGPYIGWRWLTYGYTFAINHSTFSSDTWKQKSEFQFSVYNSFLGFDFFNRRTGYDYRLLDINLDHEEWFDRMKSSNFDYFSVKMTGFNLYYIFNHHKYSYPAAFAQTTRQKRSAGSAFAGIGYMLSSLNIDYDGIDGFIKEHMKTEYSQQLANYILNSAIKNGYTGDLSDGGKSLSEFLGQKHLNDIHYHNYFITGGYVYNWVFHKNWMACGSLGAQLCYKETKAKSIDGTQVIKTRDYSPDFVGRYALVYNNDRWYGGTSLMIHTNNYNSNNIRAVNVFGNLSMYVGYNFGLRKEYRKKR